MNLENGDQLAAQGRHAEAIIEYRNAIAADERFGAARFKLAEAYVTSGNFRGALAEYVRAADLLPDDRAAQLKAAETLLLAGRYEDAKKRAEGLLAKNPRDVQAMLALANGLAGMKDPEAAFARSNKPWEWMLKVVPSRRIWGR